MELSPQDLLTSLLISIGFIAKIILGCATFIIGACAVDGYFRANPLAKQKPATEPATTRKAMPRLSASPATRYAKL